MKLLYLTNIYLPADDAQSIQVSAMAKAFGKNLGVDFLLISPRSRENKNLKTDWAWRRFWMPLFLSRFLRYGLGILMALWPVFKFRPDVVYSRDIGVLIFYRLFGFKCVYEIHKPFETKTGDLIFKFISKKIKIVAISGALKDFIVEKYGISTSGILVAHDGVFLEDFEKLDKKICRNRLAMEIKTSPDTPVVFYGSNLYKGKGLELIAGVAKILSNVLFVVMGRKDPGELADADFPNNLIYLGRKDPNEVASYTKSADMLILPFTKELKTWQYHSALKMFEYMASGVPILSSNIGSINEVLSEDNAFLFNPENLNELAEKIKFILANRELAEQRAVKALQDAEQYDWGKRARKIIDFIK